MKVIHVKQKFQYTAQVSYLCKYALEDYGEDMDDRLWKLARKFKGAFDGSGVGFGFRDNQFSFKTETSRQQFITAVKADKSLKIDHAVCSVYIDD